MELQSISGYLNFANALLFPGVSTQVISLHFFLNILMSYLFYYFMHMCFWPLCMCVHHVDAWYEDRPEKDTSGLELQMIVRLHVDSGN